jgi:hypothetical protein
MGAVLPSCPVSGYDGGLGPVTALTGSSVLAEPDLGSIFELPAGLILVSSRPREPIEKPWMCVP